MGFATRGQLAVHDHARDADALLAARLADGMETGAEQELTEHLLDARFRNSRPVVLGSQFNDVLFVVRFRELDRDVGKNARFFAGIERVVHGFLNGRDQGACQRVKPEKVLVFLEKFRNGHLLLVLSHAFCGPCHAPSPPLVLLHPGDVGPTVTLLGGLRVHNLRR